MSRSQPVFPCLEWGLLCYFLSCAMFCSSPQMWLVSSLGYPCVFPWQLATPPCYLVNLVFPLCIFTPVFLFFSSLSSVANIQLYRVCLLWLLVHVPAGLISFLVYIYFSCPVLINVCWFWIQCLLSAAATLKIIQFEVEIFNF